MSFKGAGVSHATFLFEDTCNSSADLLLQSSFSLKIFKAQNHLKYIFMKNPSEELMEKFTRSVEILSEVSVKELEILLNSWMARVRISRSMTSPCWKL